MHDKIYIGTAVVYLSMLSFLGLNVVGKQVATASMWPPPSNSRNTRRVIQLQPQWPPHNSKTPFFKRADLV